MTQNKTIADASSTLAGSTILKDIEMKITKRQLKRIIREEYSRLKRRGLLKEANSTENAASDLLGVQSQYGAEMELDTDSAIRNRDFIMKAQELTPEIAGFEYLGSCEDDEGASAWVFWDGRNYQIASGSGASWDLYTCKDAVEAYLCIEMCSYY